MTMYRRCTGLRIPILIMIMVNIEINGLRKSFCDKVAVDIDSLCLGNGDIVGLVGNNGAGKTTLFRLILDLVKADEGRVVMMHDRMEIVPSESEAWKGFTGAYIDSGFLIDFLTPEEYFAFLGSICDLSEEELTGRLKEYEPLMNGEILGQKKLIRNLSAGNKQKVGIIAAMLNNPQLLILDEPFNFLDPSSQNTLKRTLCDYHHRIGATVLLSSHNLQHTVDISNRIVLLEKGRVVSDIENVNGSAARQLDEYFYISESEG